MTSDSTLVGGAASSSSSEGLKLNLRELNPHFVCVLCFGYFVDATTVTECMHTFCKSCIVTFLQKNHHCPHCDTLLSRTKPFSSLRSDRVMQSLVYKTVPGLFQTEMRRRIHFYTTNPHPDLQSDVEDIQNYLFSPEDSVSLSIKYHNYSSIVGDGVWDTGGDAKDNDDEPPKPPKEEELTNEKPDFKSVRYFRCPATVPVTVLKALVKSKYSIQEPFRVELLYGEERLLDCWTLMEIAYIFQWKRISPMELSFQVFVTRKVKRRKLKLVRKVVDQRNSGEKNSYAKDHETMTRLEPPSKVPRLEEGSYSSTSSVVEHHPRPPTPPETPDGPFDALLAMDRHKTEARHKVQVERPPKISLKGPVVDEDVDNHPTLAAEIESTIKQLEEQTSSYVMDDPDSCDNACDQDSEAALEVDTSHETEPENENEVDIEMTEDKEDQKMEICDEEQVDSAIDVTDMNETLDDSDGGKEIDQSFSSESFDDHSKPVPEDDDEEEEDEEDEGEDEDDAEMNGSDAEDDKASMEDTKDGDKDRRTSNKCNANLSGVLDLSGHARTVRARKENSKSPEINTNKDDQQSSKLQSLLSQNEDANSPLRPISEEMLKTLQLKLNSQIMPAGGIAKGGVPRAPFPLNWPRPPMGNNPAIPQNAAAFNLMTLSHAVQLQLAMAQAQVQAQAQAQAQVQVQAQAQKMQAQVQANRLKNLRGTEILSFVNGSGDTLTISPIAGNKGNQKQKVGPKSPKLLKANHNSTKHQITKKSSVSATNDGGKNSKKDIIFPKEFKFVSKHKAESPKSNNNNNIPSKDHNHSRMSTGLKTTIPKSVLASLKIPHVSLKNIHNPKMDKKEYENERTGDPVFKITNQKLTNLARQQRLHKLKLTNKQTVGDEAKVSAPIIISQSNSTKVSPSIINSSTLNSTKLISGSPNISATVPKSIVSSTISKSIVTSTVPKSSVAPLVCKPNSSLTVSKPTIAPKPMNTSLSKINSTMVMKTSPTRNKIFIQKTPLNVSKPSSPSVSKSPTMTFNSQNKVITVSKPALNRSSPPCPPSLSKTLTNGSLTTYTSATSTGSNGVKLNTTTSNGISNHHFSMPAKCPTSLSANIPKQQLTLSSSNSTTSSVSTISCSSAIRTTSTHVRQIPNPSRLHQQSESRLTAGMNRISTIFPKKGITSSKTEGMSRIESLTRSLHEKMAASAAVTGGVLNSLAR